MCTSVCFLMRGKNLIFYPLKPKIQSSAQLLSNKIFFSFTMKGNQRESSAPSWEWTCIFPESCWMDCSQENTGWKEREVKIRLAVSLIHILPCFTKLSMGLNVKMLIIQARVFQVKRTSTFVSHYILPFPTTYLNTAAFESQTEERAW